MYIQGLYCKHTNFEQAVRAPLVFVPATRESGWENSRGKRSYAPVELLDILPTLAELTGIPSKVGKRWGQWVWQGISLVPILRDPENAWIKPLSQAQYPRGMGSTKMMGYSVRTIRYRVTTWCRTPFKLNPSCYYEMYDFLVNQQENVSIAYTQKQLRTRIVQIWDPPTLSSFAKTENRITKSIAHNIPLNTTKPFDFDQWPLITPLPKQPFP